MKKTFKTLVVMLSIGGLLVATGCSKKTVNGRVKSKTSTSTGTTPNTTTYTYDGQGRVLSIQDNNGTESYSYTQSNVTVTDPQGSTTVYTLNNQGYAGSDNTGLTYTYDNSGFLTGVSVNGGGGSQSSTYSNGDETTRTIIQNGTTTYLFTYLSNVDYRDFGKHFLGRSNTHVLNSATITQGNTSTTYTFTYNFDGDGRVVTSTQTGNNSIVSTTYTY